MTMEEIKIAVQENRITEELLKALVYFTFDFDPYGFLNEWGHPEDEGVMETVIEEMRYQVVECKTELLETIGYAIENKCVFRNNY